MPSFLPKLILLLLAADFLLGTSMVARVSVACDGDGDQPFEQLEEEESKAEFEKIEEPSRVVVERLSLLAADGRRRMVSESLCLPEPVTHGPDTSRGPPPR